MAPYRLDFRLLERLDSSLVPVTLGSADSLSAENFERFLNIENKCDHIYVANHGPIGRVDSYVQALTRVSQRRRASVPLNSSPGWVKNTYAGEMRASAECVRASGNMDFQAGVKQSQLNECLNNPNLNVLDSSRDRANKGLAESLYAGTPSLLIYEALGRAFQDGCGVFDFWDVWWHETPDSAIPSGACSIVYGTWRWLPFGIASAIAPWIFDSLICGSSH